MDLILTRKTAASSNQPSHPRRSEPISTPAGPHLKKRLRRLTIGVHLTRAGSANTQDVKSNLNPSDHYRCSCYAVMTAKSHGRWPAIAPRLVRLVSRPF